MKPSLRSTAFAFLVLGLGFAAWGFVGVLPSPTQIGIGAAMALTGIGLLFRVRLAHNAGLLIATATSGFGGWNLYRALEDSHHLGIVKASVTLAVGLYLLISLAFTRAQLAPAKK